VTAQYVELRLFRRNVEKFIIFVLANLQ